MKITREKKATLLEISILRQLQGFTYEECYNILNNVIQGAKQSSVVQSDVTLKRQGIKLNVVEHYVYSAAFKQDPKSHQLITIGKGVAETKKAKKSPKKKV